MAWKNEEMRFDSRQ